MAIAALEIPDINPLLFLPQDGELPVDPRDNLIHFNADWFVRYIRDWQSKSTYVQPWQFNDRIAIHFHTNGGAFFPDVNLIDCSGKLWHTWTPTVVYNASGVGIKVGNTSIPADTYHIKLRLSDVAGLPEGIYVFHLVQTFDLDADTVADYTRNNVSEPFSVATEQFGTVRIDYYNSYNSQSVLFKQTNARFSIRLHADIVEYAPASNDTNYEDGGYNARLLASVPYRTAKFATTERIPEWMLDKLNRAWGCDHVSVDSRAFTKEPGGKWEINRIARVPKVAAALPIREADNEAASRQVVVTGFIFYTIPSFPYVVLSASMESGSGTVSFVDEPVLIEDSTAQTAFIATLNALAVSEDYSGSFSVVGGNVVWTNVGSDLFLSATTSLMFTPFGYELTSNSAEAILFENPNVVIDYGDGTPMVAVNGSGYITAPEHVYAAPGTYEVRIFGNYTYLGFDDGFMENLSGQVSSLLTSFELKNSFTITDFDVALLAPAGSHLQSIRVYDCANLTLISNLIQTFPNIIYIDFSGNNLDTIQISDAVISVLTMLDNTGGPLYGFLDVSDQLTGDGILFGAGGQNQRDDIVNIYGWTVVND